jgi:hypothetical protein
VATKDSSTAGLKQVAQCSNHFSIGLTTLFFYDFLKTLRDDIDIIKRKA